MKTKNKKETLLAAAKIQFNIKSQAGLQTNIWTLTNQSHLPTTVNKRCTYL